MSRITGVLTAMVGLVAACSAGDWRPAIAEWRPVVDGPLRVDSGGLEIALVPPFIAPKLSTALCITLDSTSYGTDDLRPWELKPDPKGWQPSLTDTIRIRLSGSIRSTNGQWVELIPTIKSVPYGGCLVPKDLRPGTTYGVLRVRSSLPVTVQRISWWVDM